MRAGLLVLTVLIVIVGSIMRVQAQQPPTYHLTDLSAPLSPGGAASVNMSGEAAGWVEENGGPMQAFFYKKGTLTDLGTVAGDYGAAIALNNNGTVVGNVDSPSDDGSEAFVYSDGQSTLLGFLPGFDESFACAMNDSGVIVGGMSAAPGGLPSEPIVVGNGVMTDLELPPGALSGIAYCINNKDEIAGTYWDDDGNAHMVIFDNPGFTDLGTLGGYAVVPSGVNNSGQITGWFNDQSGTIEGFLYDKGAVTDLGTLYGYSSTEPYSINDDGQIVGACIGGDEKGFIYSGGQIYDLTSLLDAGAQGYSVLGGLSISNNGQIAAEGFLTSVDRPILLTPDNTSLSPMITSIQPTAIRGAESFTLTLKGTGFTSNTTIDWNNTPVPTHLVSKTEVTAAITPEVNSVLSSNVYPGSANIVAVNPGGASSPATIAITEPKPSITSINPTSVPFGNNTAINVKGQGFIPGVRVTIGGTTLTPAYISSTQIGFYAEGALVAKPRTVYITAHNPNGLNSNSAPFTITGTFLSLTVGTPKRDSSNNIDIPITITDIGPNPTSPVQIDAWLLGYPMSNPIPLTIDALSAGQSESTILTFKAGILKAGSKVPLLIQYTYAGSSNRLGSMLVMP